MIQSHTYFYPFFFIFFFYPRNFSEKIVVVVLNGPHHNDLLHEIADQFFRMKLDVIQVEFDHEGNLDKHVFYLQHMDEGKSISRALRHKIRANIAIIYKSHFDQTNECLEMSVRPMKTKHAHKVNGGGGGSTSSLQVGSEDSSVVSNMIECDTSSLASSNQNVKRYRFSSKTDTVVPLPPTLAEEIILGAEEKKQNKEVKKRIEILIDGVDDEEKQQTSKASSSDATATIQEIPPSLPASTSPRLGHEGLKKMIENKIVSPRQRPKSPGGGSGGGGDKSDLHLCLEGKKIPTGASMNVPVFYLDGNRDHPFHEDHDQYQRPTLELLGVKNGEQKGRETDATTEDSSTIEEVDIDVALESSLESPPVGRKKSYVGNDLNLILKSTSLGVIETDDDYVDSDDEPAAAGNEEKTTNEGNGNTTKTKEKTKKSGGHGSPTNWKSFFTVLGLSVLLVALDIIFSFTILKNHTPEHVNTTCVHMCADSCQITCNRRDDYQSHKNTTVG
jgi:hypothetical protein